MKRRFNKLVIRGVQTKPGHSYMLMCNHFSFWDGMLAIYLYQHAIKKEGFGRNLHIMSLKKQMEMNPWLRYFGSFSVNPATRSVAKSLSHAAELLSIPGNVLLMYPQGNLESIYVRDIVMKDGIHDILNQVDGDCQLLWSSNLIEYFESLKPSVYFHMFDCGTNRDIDFNQLGKKINTFHKAAVQKQFRFTKE